MSMHQIEDLVEETVHLIDAADLSAHQKREIFSNLFALQSWYFDTSYTHFRVIDILLKYRFVYKLALEQYPDLAVSMNFAPVTETEGWIKSNDSNETPLAYALKENGQTWLYFDAGEALWQQLCSDGMLSGDDQHPPEKLSVLPLINFLLAEAEKQQQRVLLAQWYALLVNGILAADFSGEDGIPQTFTGFLQHEVLGNIRIIAQRNKEESKRKGSDSDDYLTLPALKAAVEVAQDVEDAGKVRFLLDLKKPVQALAAAYEKESKAADNPDKKIRLIFEKMNAFLAPDNWTFVPQQQPERWLWYKDTPEQHRRFIMLDLDIKEKTLFCKQALQHALLLKWQRREAEAAPRYFHFYRDIVAFLTDDWMEQNKKHHSQWGGWKYDIKKPESALTKSIDNLTEALKVLGDTYFDFLCDEFPDKFFARNPDQLLDVLENGEGDFGIVPEYVLFDSKYHILLAFSLHHFDEGHNSKGEALIEKAKAMAASGKISTHLKEAVLDPVFEHWLKNRALYFPVSWNKYMFDYLHKQAVQ